MLKILVHREKCVELDRSKCEKLAVPNTLPSHFDDGSNGVVREMKFESGGYGLVKQ